jgi:RND family efflux transporter MFP subunit
MKTLHLFVILVGASCLAAGCTRTQAVEAPTPRPVKVQAATLAPRQATVRYAASIEPRQQVTLSFKASGYVNVVVERRGADGAPRTIQAGDLVTKGALLARLDAADALARVEQARARLAEADAAQTRARLDVERARTLFAADSLVKPELDAAQAAFDAAQARVMAGRADLDLASNALRDCALIAPASGVLLERRIEVGTLVTPGSVGFLLGDLSAVKARFGIPDAMIPSVTLGARMTVGVDAVSGAAFDGQVTALAPAADPQSRVFDVEVTIPNADGRLRPGMIGTVSIGTVASGSGSSGTRAASDHAATALAVPLGAVVRTPDGVGAGDGSHRYALLVVERRGHVEVARLRPIELGEVMGNGVAVTRGLSTSDRVIVTGANLLTDGDPVRVIP